MNPRIHVAGAEDEIGVAGLITCGFCPERAHQRTIASVLPDLQVSNRRIVARAWRNSLNGEMIGYIFAISRKVCRLLSSKSRRPLSRRGHGMLWRARKASKRSSLKERPS